MLRLDINAMLLHQLQSFNLPYLLQIQTVQMYCAMEGTPEQQLLLQMAELLLITTHGIPALFKTLLLCLTLLPAHTPVPLLMLKGVRLQLV